MKIQLFVLVALCLLQASLATVTSVTANAANTFTVNSNAASSPTVVVRITGLTTNLVLTTNYLAAVTGTSGNYVITVSNINTGNYTFDDGASVFTPTNGILSYCATPDLPAITLDTSTNSQTVASPTSGRLRLQLRFLENIRYYSISYAHTGGGATNCNSAVTSTVDTTFQTWNRTVSTASCGAQYMVMTYDFNWALTYCSYYRDETDPNNTVFNGTIIVTTIDTGVVIRGTQYPRTLSTAITVKIAFQTNISTSNNQASIFGSHILYAAITQQLWSPTTFTATLTLLTSVQWPYQLAYSSLTSVAGSGNWNTETFVASPQDSNTDINNVAWSQRSQCYNTTGATSTGALASLYGNICNQYWTFTISRSTPCSGGNSVTLADVFTVYWNVTCPKTFTGACTTPAPYLDATSFTTNSTNYCPQLITNNNANTATLASYSNIGYSTAQTQFVFGTVTYFQANITSPILMSNVAVEYVYVTVGGTNSANGNVYYSRPYTGSPGVYFSTAPAAANYASSSATACNSANYATASAMSVTDNADGASNAFTKLTRFSILWNACSSAATGDAPQSTTVQMNIRIRYTNQTTVSLPVTFSVKVPSRARTLDDTDSTTTTANVGIYGDSSDVTAGSTASSSTTMVVIAIMAAIIVATILVVVVAVVVIRRQRVNNKENPQLSSVNLVSTSSTGAPTA